MSEGMKCDECGEIHNEMYLHSDCHPKIPLWAKFNDEHSTITLECAACGKPVGIFTVVTSPEMIKGGAQLGTREN